MTSAAVQSERDDDVMRKGRIIRVSCEVVIPCDATPNQVEEWLDFELGANGSCSGDNPLLQHGIEADDVDLEDTETYLHETASNFRPSEGGGVQYSVRRQRLPEPPTGPSLDEQVRPHADAALAKADPTTEGK